MENIHNHIEVAPQTANLRTDNNIIFFDEFKILSFTNSFSKIYLIENLSDLWYNNECDIFQYLHSIEKEATEYKKTIIVFISSANSRINETYINNHLLLNK